MSWLCLTPAGAGNPVEDRAELGPKDGEQEVAGDKGSPSASEVFGFVWDLPTPHRPIIRDGVRAYTSSPAPTSRREVEDLPEGSPEGSPEEEPPAPPALEADDVELSPAEVEDAPEDVPLPPVLEAVAAATDDEEDEEEEAAADVDAGAAAVDADVEDAEMGTEAGAPGSAASTAGEEDVASDIAGRWRPAPEDPTMVELPSEGEVASPRPFLLPRDVFDRLYPYQRTGVAWMARLFERAQGGILADEMGLGKTIQVCALLNGARKAGATHALLLLPVTLLDQWAKEARSWCPGWPVYTYYGTAAQRARALRGVLRPMGGLLLTSYALIGNTDELFDVTIDDAPSPRRRGRIAKSERALKRRRLGDDDDAKDREESDEDRPEPEAPPGELPAAGLRKPWDIVVCDEAHRMKNISTLLGKSLRNLKSRSRILLTGTPVQNALQDLWALMDFAQPGLLGNHATFVKTFSEPIDRGSVRGANAFSVELKKHLSAQLRALISPHILRRTKAAAGLLGVEPGVADDAAAGGAAPDVAMEDAVDEELADGAVAKKLPPKKETIVWLTPSPEQESAYKKVLEKSEVIREAAAKQKLGVEVFRAIGLLKRLCNHPVLLLPAAKPAAWAEVLSDATAGSDGAREPNDEAVVLSEARDSLDLPGMTGTAAEDDARSGRAVEMMLRKLPRTAEALTTQSAKLRCLARLLPALAAKGHRALVFSQSVKMLDLIQICCLKPNGLRCLRIDGQTEPTARAEKVAKFQQQRDRFQCMLLTTNVGGVGLNLTSADRVVLVDPAWNPATDAQAVDRAFRIGQEREVRVYRLIMSGLIEDKMFRLQVFKMGLTKTALEADQNHRYFTAREIRALFEWTEPAEGETRRLLNEKHSELPDEAVALAAEEDGAEGEDGWIKSGSVLGLSDFTALYGAVAQEEEPDDACTAQVLEAKLRLCAADEKLNAMREAREKAEAQRDTSTKDYEEAVNAAELLKDKRARAEEVVREKRGELAQARKAEASAQQRLDKAGRSRVGVQDQQLRSQQAVTTATEAADAAGRCAAEAGTTAKASEEAFTKAIADAEAQLSQVSENGQAVGTSAVDAAADRTKKALKALEKLRSSLETATVRQVELEAAEEELLRADAGHGEACATCARLGQAPPTSANPEVFAAVKTAELAQRSREKDRQRAEQAQGKAQQRAEASRDAVQQALQAFAEAGASFIESFQKTQARPVRVDQVKAAQSAAKASLRQLASAWTAAKKSREAASKAAALRRKALQRVHSAAASSAEAERWLGDAEREYAAAAAEEQLRRSERGARESDLGAAEAFRAAAEVEEAESKRKRDELKASLPNLRDAVKAAKAAEREATLERQQLHAACSRVEKAQLQLEEAKTSAIQTLKAEEYDSRQVEKAYEQTRKAAD